MPSLTGAIPLTDSAARKHLKDVSRCLGFQKSFTFHDSGMVGPLGLSGMGVSLQDIQAQGTWSFSCVWYIFKCLSLAPPLLLLHFVPTFLFDYLSTGCLGIVFLLLPVCTIILSHLKAILLYILWYASSYGGVGYICKHILMHILLYF